MYIKRNINILKVNNGRVEFRRDSGGLVRTIGTGNAVDARWQRDSDIAITTTKGRIESRRECGKLIRIT